jgi:hypothetical protein
MLGSFFSMILTLKTTLFAKATLLVGSRLAQGFLKYRFLLEFGHITPSANNDLTELQPKNPRPSLPGNGAPE